MRLVFIVVCICVSASVHGACGGGQRASEAKSEPAALDPREVHLEGLVQLTRDRGENAEAYWSFAGDELIMQSKRPPFSCDQIYRLPLDGSKPRLVSTGLGRSTCSYFLPGDDEIVYSSTHAQGGECPPVPDHSQGYVWPIYDAYDIYVASADGSNLRNLSASPKYDAEATVCASDGTIVFTSTRNGDLDLYRMDRDGGNVVQLTDTPGYDGGAFFSKDCSQITWRASRPRGEALLEYQKLLGEGLVRPSKLEIFVAKSDGSQVRQLTYLDAASFAPFFHPGGKRVLFSSNVGDKGGREFDIWAVNTDGTGLERITYAEGFDGFPMFSPDGTKLAFSSNRNQAKPGETDVFIADWKEEGKGQRLATGAEAFVGKVAWLADDAREGRGVGTAGIEEAADWLAARFAALGLVEGNGESFFQSLDVAVKIEACTKCSLSIGKIAVANEDIVPAGFSASGKITAQSVAVGFGIEAHELGVDDFKGKNLQGKIAVVRRYTPDTEVYKDRKHFDTYSSLHRKAFTAREKGAVAVIIVNGVPPGIGEDQEADLPPLALDRLGAVGIPVIVVRSKAGASLLNAPRRVSIEVQLDVVKKSSRNVVGLLPASKGKSEGTIVVGAHYDHLGYGGEHSLAGGESVIHNGADDNASGVAALLEVAETLSKVKERRRDIVFVAFTGEENGLLGSKYFVEHLPAGLEPVAMLNMDMVGRMRSNRLSVLGVGTATEWEAMARAACDQRRIDCTVGGDGYGPSDHSSFTAAGVPILYFSTGAHAEYHTPGDDTSTINAIGGVQIAGLVADLTLLVANSDERLTLQRSAMPSSGDRRSFGASLGTIPDYSGDTSKPGMLLSGVRPGGAADLAGITSGDRILSIGDTTLHSVKDLVYVLQAAKPGDTAFVKVGRGGQILMLKVQYQKSSPRPH